MTRTLFYPLPLALAMLAASPMPVLANGELYFVAGRVSIVSDGGRSRPAKKGDQVRPGERVVAGENAMAQIRMADGSFIGVRPDSNVRIRDFRAAGADSGSVLVLDWGSVRVLNVATNDKSNPLPVQVHRTDGARVLLRAGDLESGDPGGTDGALFTRLNSGTASARTNQGEAALATNNVTKVTPKSIAPAPISVLPPVTIMTAAPSSTARGQADAPIAPTVQQGPPPGTVAGFSAPGSDSPAQSALRNFIPEAAVGGNPRFNTFNSSGPGLGSTNTEPPLTTGTVVSEVVNHFFRQASGPNAPSTRQQPVGTSRPAATLQLVNPTLQQQSTLPFGRSGRLF